ncbi:hypothetical protein BH18ACT4_BH18ACT4_05160 [soil metagenome]
MTEGYGATVPTCSTCGASVSGGDENLPAGWSLASSERGVDRVCAACTRTNIRAIEAKLAEEWWE